MQEQKRSHLLREFGVFSVIGVVAAVVQAWDIIENRLNSRPAVVAPQDPSTADKPKASDRQAPHQVAGLLGGTTPAEGPATAPAPPPSPPVIDAAPGRWVVVAANLGTNKEVVEALRRAASSWLASLRDEDTVSLICFSTAGPVVALSEVRGDLARKDLPTRVRQLLPNPRGSKDQALALARRHLGQSPAGGKARVVVLTNANARGFAEVSPSGVD